MSESKGKALVLPSNGGRKLMVLGIEITLKLTTSETGGDFYLFEALTPPGLGVPLHVHQHEDEIVQVTEGEFEIALGGKTYAATEGTVANWPRLTPHGFTNIGKKPGRITFTVIPGISFEKFFEDLSGLPTDQPPDMARVVEVFRRYGMEILAHAAP